MAGDYSRKQKTANSHLESLTSARFFHIDGSTTTNVIVPTGSGCNLLRVTLNTKGATLTIRTGPRVIGVISSTAAEGEFPYGVYCENGLTVDASTTCDATVVFDR